MSKPFIPSIAIAGCGGQTSYLLPPLISTFKPSHVHLLDGDTFETHNLSRQLVPESAIGKNKAVVFAERIQHLVQSMPESLRFPVDVVAHETWFTPATAFDQYLPDVVVSCIDNHEGRAAVLSYCDDNNVPAVIGGNDFFDASASIYLPSWSGSDKDPRVIFPEILTDKTNSPLSCLDEDMLKNTPQLAIANSLAANLILVCLWRLFVVSKENKSALDVLPYYFEINEMELTHGHSEC
jgi:molybdopterin/thiamine biosynthesis adenylyltransferase